MVRIRCAATSAVGSASSLHRGRGLGLGQVLHPDLQPDRPPRARHRGGAHDTAPASGRRRRTATRCSAGQRLAVLAARHGELPDAARAEQLGRADGELDLAFDRLVPGRHRRPGPARRASVLRRWTCRNRRMTCTLGLPGVLEHALGLGEAALRGIGGRVLGRHDHAELPPAAVLLGRGPVRVQDVALVEDGVGDAAHGVEAHARVSHGCLACAGPSGRRRSGAAEPPGPSAGLGRRGLGQQGGQGGVPGRQRVLGLVRGQRVQRHVAARQPGAAGEVRVHQVVPDADRHPVGGLGAPRHQLDREAARRWPRRRCR